MWANETTNRATCGHPLALGHAQRRLAFSFSFFFYPSIPVLFTPFSCQSLHLILLASTCPRARLREAAFLAVPRRWWADGRETLVSHYDRGESHYMIRMAFFLGCLMCLSHSSIHLTVMRDRLSHSRQRARRKKSPGASGKNRKAANCLNAHTRALSPALQGYDNAIKLTP